MDFIERILGISPDGGSGSLEALYLTIAVVVAGYLCRRWIVAHRR
jgi:hypothetical protein